MQRRGKFGGNFIPETLKKPVEDLELLFEKLSKKLNGAQIWAKVVSDANGGAHKIYNATVHSLIAKRA